MEFISSVEMFRVLYAKHVDYKGQKLFNGDTINGYTRKDKISGNKRED